VPQISAAIPARASTVAGLVRAARLLVRRKIAFPSLDRELRLETTAAEILRDIRRIAARRVRFV
jgi:hypothetical protein